MFTHLKYGRPGKPRGSQVRRRALALELLESRQAPAVFNVISTADNNDAVITAGHAGTAADPYQAPSLRSAISAANADTTANTINLTIAGTYKITIPGAGEDNNATGDFDILPHAGGDLTIINTSGGATVVDGNQLDRVFDINPTDSTDPTTQIMVTFELFTIQNGTVSGTGASGSGGGIRDQGNANLTLTNMVVTNNNAGADGGGIAMKNTAGSTPWTLTLNGTTVSNNSAGAAGGGIETDGGGTVAINNGSALTGNTAANQGGGVWLGAIGTESSSLTMMGTLVANNHATQGLAGGIGNSGNGIVFLDRSTITNNSAGSDGGGFGDQNNLGELTVSNSVFLNNTASLFGGAISEGGPALNIQSSEIEGNSSMRSGGGVFVNGTTLLVNDSTLAGNTAAGPYNGGAIECETVGGTGGFIGGGSIISNTTITGNNASNGGGIDADVGFTGALTLQNDTINANSAGNGGGVLRAGAVGSTFTVINTIIAQNTATSGPDANNPTNTFIDDGGNLIGVSGPGSANTGFTSPTTQTGTVANPLDPLLGPLQDNGSVTLGIGAGSTTPLQTEALLPASMALDMGVAGSLTTDERGFVRPDSGDTPALPDIGAFETQDTNLGVSITGSGSLLVVVGQSVTYTITVANNIYRGKGPPIPLPDDNSTLAVTLPSFLTETAASPGAAVNGNTITFRLGALDANVLTTYTVTATANGTGVGITPDVTAVVTSPDANPNSVSATASISVLNAFLTVSVSASHPFVATGSNETFTVTVTNEGNLEFPAGLATVTASLPAGLTVPPGTPLTFNVGALSPPFMDFPTISGQSESFSVTATAAAVGAQAVTATVNRPYTNPLSANTTVSVLTPAERFVQAEYQAELGRLGTISELDFWANQLTAGVSQTAVASAILHSPEASNYLVNGWYAKYLFRAPLNGEEQPFVDQLLAGATEELVQSEILGSAEYWTRNVAGQALMGTLQQQLVQQYYQVLLGRTTSDTDPEVNYWANLMPSLGAGGVALGIMTSQEYRGNTVTGYYNTLLHRPPESGAVAWWVATGNDLGTIRSGIEGSQEFYTNG